MRTAVCTVMCSEPMIRAPARGFDERCFSRIDMRPGISCSASSISLRPKATVSGDRSATLNGRSENRGSPVFMKVSVVGLAVAVLTAISRVVSEGSDPDGQAVQGGPGLNRRDRLARWEKVPSPWRYDRNRRPVRSVHPDEVMDECGMIELASGPVNSQAACPGQGTGAWARRGSPAAGRRTSRPRRGGRHRGPDPGPRRRCPSRPPRRSPERRRSV